MPHYPSHFIVRVAMTGYLHSSGHYRHSRPFQPGIIYTAEYVGRNHLVAIRADRPAEQVWLPLRSKWWWDRIEFEPNDKQLARLLAPNHPAR